MQPSVCHPVLLHNARRRHSYLASTLTEKCLCPSLASLSPYHPEPSVESERIAILAEGERAQSEEGQGDLEADCRPLLLFQICRCSYSIYPLVTGKAHAKCPPCAQLTMQRATCGKESSLLPPLLTSAKLHLPFCFTDCGSKNRHKLASQDNSENQR